MVYYSPYITGSYFIPYITQPTRGPFFVAHVKFWSTGILLTKAPGPLPWSSPSVHIVPWWFAPLSCTVWFWSQKLRKSALFCFHLHSSLANMLWVLACWQLPWGCFFPKSPFLRILFTFGWRFFQNKPSLLLSWLFFSSVKPTAAWLHMLPLPSLFHVRTWAPRCLPSTKVPSFHQGVFLPPRCLPS